MCSRDVCSQIISVDRLGLTLLYAIARDFFLNVFVYFGVGVRRWG